jgi:signal transduction histidine kinase
LLELRATHGTSGDLDTNIATLRSRGGDERAQGVGQAIARGVPVQMADLQAEGPFPIYRAIVEAGYRAVLAVPLISPNRVVGALVLRRRAPGEFSERTIDLMRSFAAQSAIAIQNAHWFQQIEEKSQELALASQHKSQFLANMSHELRTPLNAILGYTELILDDIYGETPKKMRTVLERVQSNGKHLLGLINDVLDLSKIEAGELVLRIEPYSVQDMVQTVVSSLEPLAAQKKLSLKAEVSADLPTGHGDERRIQQVLLNLVGNAIKFTEAGEVAISASVSGGAFTFAVRDTGPGIDVADQSKIFEEFRQADDSNTRKKGGTGLGLAISKRIAEMHGGRISVESALGEGSTFFVTMPINAEAK